MFGFWSPACFILQIFFWRLTLWLPFDSFNFLLHVSSHDSHFPGVGPPYALAINLRGCALTNIENITERLGRLRKSHARYQTVEQLASKHGISAHLHGIHKKLFTGRGVIPHQAGRAMTSLCLFHLPILLTLWDWKVRFWLQEGRDSKTRWISFLGVGYFFFWVW